MYIFRRHMHYILHVVYVQERERVSTMKGFTGMNAFLIFCP